jgi:S1-C subfamily serine protease
VRTGFIPDMGSDDARGMKISGVVGGSPAETAGVKAGDILTSFDGKPIKNIEALQQVLSTAKPDVEVEIIVIRGTETLKFKIKPAQGQAQFGFDPTYHPEFDDDHDHKHTDGEPL